MPTFRQRDFLVDDVMRSKYRNARWVYTRPMAQHACMVAFQTCHTTETYMYAHLRQRLHVAVVQFLGVSFRQVPQTLWGCILACSPKSQTIPMGSRYVGITGKDFSCVLSRFYCLQNLLTCKPCRITRAWLLFAYHHVLSRTVLCWLETRFRTA